MTHDFDLVIRAPRVISPEGEVARAIGIRGGRIAAVEPLDARVTADSFLELDADVVLLPGLVDSHVHICEPGNTDWEGFASATKAAAAGGITTLVDMPIDSIPSTVNVEALETKRRSAEGQCHTDMGFWGGVVPDNLNDLLPLHEAGVLGFKCFLGDCGTPDFPGIEVGHMEDALGVLCDLDTPLLVHAEAASSIPEVHGRKYSDFLASRPRGLENLAVAQVIEAARKTGAHAHILHVSSSDVLPMIASARRDGVFLTAETCPHYLTLCAEDIPDGATAFKCGPVIREADNRELLWGGLKDLILGQIVSDHSPATVAMKEPEDGDFGAAWGGVSSLQLGLSVVWTGMHGRGFSLSDIAGWMSERPAQLAGLVRKGRIAPGCDADFCVFAPHETFVVDPAKLYHRHPVTPYAGRELRGVVRMTILRGQRIDLQRPRGELLTRGAA